MWHFAISEQCFENFAGLRRSVRSHLDVDDDARHAADEARADDTLPSCFIANAHRPHPRAHVDEPADPLRGALYHAFVTLQKFSDFALEIRSVCVRGVRQQDDVTRAHDQCSERGGALFQPFGAREAQAGAARSVQTFDEARGVGGCIDQVDFYLFVQAGDAESQRRQACPLVTTAASG